MQLGEQPRRADSMERARPIEDRSDHSYDGSFLRSIISVASTRVLQILNIAQASVLPASSCTFLCWGLLKKGPSKQGTFD